MSDDSNNKESQLERDCKNCIWATPYLPPYEDEFAYDILSNRGRIFVTMCGGPSKYYGQKGVSGEAKTCNSYKPKTTSPASSGS